MDVYLNQTMTCKICKGTGILADKENKTVPCGTCKGSGAVIDSEIAVIIKKYIPNVDRSVIPKILEDIYNYVEFKLKDSYERGKVDGRLEQKVEEK